MKFSKITLFAFASIFAIATTSCKKDEVKTLEQSQNEQAGTMTFHCVSDPQSSLKTTVKADGVTPIWSENDQIRITNATNLDMLATNVYSISNGAGTTYAEFTGSSFTGPYYAIYPARAKGAMFPSFTSNGEIAFEIPNVQLYREGSFAEQTAPVVAYSETTDLNFKQVCGYLKLGLNGSGTISHIRLTDTSGFAISGTFVVKPADETPIATVATLDNKGCWNGKSYAAGNNTITIDCGDGLTLSGTDKYVWFVLPVGALEHGFRLLAYTTDGRVAEINATANNKITRGNVKIIKNITLTNFESLMQTSDACGEIYPLVQIGEQIWTQENMRCHLYDMRGERKYDATPTTNTARLLNAGYMSKPNSYSTQPIYYDFRECGVSPYTANLTPELRKKLGLSYSYAAAMGGCSGMDDYQNLPQYPSTTPRQGICPYGFRVPTIQDFDVLLESIGADRDIHGQSGAEKLKTEEGWYAGNFPRYSSEWPSFNGTNEFGFSLLPSGFRRQNHLETTDATIGYGVGLAASMIIGNSGSYNKTSNRNTRRFETVVTEHNTQETQYIQYVSQNYDEPGYMCAVRCIKN
ncbi:MAG: hypothetical protein MJ009_00210 [Paludibacteraceae bacterium]|nr:hypothetical protein [Paludibacteraceae bacterium]